MQMELKASAAANVFSTAENYGRGAAQNIAALVLFNLSHGNGKAWRNAAADQCYRAGLGDSTVRRQVAAAWAIAARISKSYSDHADIKALAIDSVDVATQRVVDFLKARNVTDFAIDGKLWSQSDADMLSDDMKSAARKSKPASGSETVQNTSGSEAEASKEAPETASAVEAVTGDQTPDAIDALGAFLSNPYDWTDEQREAIAYNLVVSSTMEQLQGLLAAINAEFAERQKQAEAISA